MKAFSCKGRGSKLRDDAEMHPDKDDLRFAVCSQSFGWCWEQTRPNFSWIRLQLMRIDFLKTLEVPLSVKRNLQPRTEVTPEPWRTQTWGDS